MFPRSPPLYSTAIIARRFLIAAFSHVRVIFRLGLWLARDVGASRAQILQPAGDTAHVSLSFSHPTED